MLKAIEELKRKEKEAKTSLRNDEMKDDTENQVEFAL